MSSCFNINLWWGQQSEESSIIFYGALLYGLLCMESCHEIYSARSWLSGRKPAVFHDILIA